MTTLRERERASIAAFLRANEHHFAGNRVLDFGSGKQPYREIIEEAGGEYFGYDSSTFPASTAVPEQKTMAIWAGLWDVIVCTQVVQYVPNVPDLLSGFHEELADRAGVLLMTGPTNWPIVEQEDLWRFTLRGIIELLGAAGFGYVEGDYRHSSRCEGEEYPHGWAVVARP